MRRESGEQHLVKGCGVLNLRRVAEFGKLHQFRALDAHRRGFRQLRIVPQRGANARGSKVLADGGVVLVADNSSVGTARSCSS